MRTIARMSDAERPTVSAADDARDPAPPRENGVATAETDADGAVTDVAVTGAEQAPAASEDEAPAAPEPEPAATSEPAPITARFPVDVEGFRGGLDELVQKAQRGDIDLTGLKVADVTAQVRGQIESAAADDLREAADGLSLLARLVALKAARVLPDGAEVTPEEAEEELVEQAGRRLEEYRLFKAAVDALLADAAEEGTRSFLGMVAPEVIPVERLRIPPERLAAAFRAVLERLQDSAPLPVGAATFSVEEKVAWLRDRLASVRSLAFDAVFADVRSRLEAVACFLALLELLKRGEAVVEQESPFAPITVSSGA